MKRMKLVPAVLVVLALSSTSQAQEMDSKAVPSMDEVVVTATRTETSSDKVGGSTITVLTSDEIEAKQQVSVKELLKGIPGLDVVSNGGGGTLSKVFIRGADAKNTLVLVDGVMLNDTSSTDRSANLATITTDNIDRIEVVKGPMSVLYGSTATAGVINIITKTGKGKPGISLTMEGGSYNTFKLSGGVSGASEKISYAIHGSTFRADGFSTANDDNDRIPHAGNTSENDGWQNSTFSGKVSAELRPGVDVSGVVRYVNASVDLDDYNYSNQYAGDRFGGWPQAAQPTMSKEARSENDLLIYRINLHNAFQKSRLLSDLFFQSTVTDRQNYDNDGMPNWDYEGRSNEIGWQGQMDVGDHSLLIGASFQTEEMDSVAETINKKKSDMRSVFVQDQLLIGENIDIVAGARMDDHDRFGSEITWRFAPAYHLPSTGTDFRASYGTGFRSPSLYQLYSFSGNVNLQAEKSKGFDVGLEQTVRGGDVRMGITYFNTVFEDRIDYDMSTWLYSQMPGDTKISGVEAFVKWMPLEQMQLLLDYTYTDTKDPDEKRLVRRPLNKVHLNCMYEFMAKTDLNMDVYWIDERDEGPVTDVNGLVVTTLKSYFLVNLAGHYALSDTLTLVARIDNLLGEEYEEAWSYASPGRSGYVGVRASF